MTPLTREAFEALGPRRMMRLKLTIEQERPTDVPTKYPDYDTQASLDLLTVPPQVAWEIYAWVVDRINKPTAVFMGPDS